MPRLLYVGTSGPDVIELQSMLNRSIPPVPRLAEDGKFGPATKASLIKFQSNHGLDADGIFGPITHAVLAANHVLKDAPSKKAQIEAAWYKAMRST